MAIVSHTFFLVQLLLVFFACLAEANNSRKVYLVQMKVGEHRYGSSSGHQELLSEVLEEDRSIADALIYSYKESFTGFSARLTQNERRKLKRRREVLEVSRSRNLKLHTTRSWDFMNLTLTAKRNPEVESDLVVAVIDSGIWPYSELFQSDSPPPLAWQNKCHNITCNNKIVGARSYYPGKANYNLTEENSVIDIMGHGTHVASIVAGREIEKASYFGLADGTMRGGVPNAKIAVYKTCWKVRNESTGKDYSVCPQDEVLRAIDDAIEDKVHIISYSQGLISPSPLQKDQISWAFLRALKHGILTSTSAGNLGTFGTFGNVINGAPWVITVAASLKDRSFVTKLELKGEDDPITVYNTINTFETQDSFYPLALEKESDESTRKRELIAMRKNAPISYNHTIDVKGKDVFFNYSHMTILKKAIKDRAKGAIAFGTFSNLNESTKLQFPIPSIFLDEETEDELREYYYNKEEKSSHLVKIHKTVEIPNEEEPAVADLSSRGPNCDNFLANILKPDIAAPGLDIIAGWPENVKLLSEVPTDDYRHLRFNILSGTSMACPHVTGLALYLKSFNPSWTPSAIKSALMTTSTEMAGEGYGFAYGSGHLNATKVLDPGLIYETGHQDYVDYMCKQGYNTEKLRSHVGRQDIDCSRTKMDNNTDLNYPTMTARVEPNAIFSKVFYRKVTNVGDRNTTYLGKVEFLNKKDIEARITLEPTRLHFSDLGETKTFVVNVTGQSESEFFMMASSLLTWTEIGGSRKVRSPIVIYSIAKESEVCSRSPKK